MNKEASKADRILLVEDEESVLITLSAVLRSEGYNVRTALGGVAALEVLRIEAFDLILTDLRMDQVDGLDVLKVAGCLWPPPAVVILTGYASLDSAVEAMRLGAYSYLVKPCNIEELKLSVDRALERRRYREIELLYQMSRRLTETLDLEKILRDVLDEARRITGLSEASILLREASGSFEVRAVSPQCAPIDARKVASIFDTPDAARRLTEGDTLIFLRGADETPLDRMAEQEGLRSVLVVPLLHQNSVKGVLMLKDRQNDREILPGELRLIQGLVHHASIAIAQSRLVSDLERANADLRTMDEFKSKLLSTLTHELKTPIVAVKGYNQMLLREKEGPITPKQREFLQISLDNINRQLLLIDGLLDYSRLDRNGGLLKTDRIDLGEILNDCLMAIRPEAQGTMIDLEAELPPSALPIVADRLRLTQAFSNLLSNAIKFTPPGGRVRVSCKSETDGCYVIRVSDTGIGIPESIQDRIFERFFQADSSNARRYRGLGLGLAITREVIALHYGTVSVESRAGAGSTFIVTLPRSAEALLSEAGRKKKRARRARPNSSLKAQSESV